MAGPSADVREARGRLTIVENGPPAGYERVKGSQVHATVDTPNHSLTQHVTPVDTQGREPVGALAEAVQEATGGSVELAWVDQGDIGEAPA